MTAIRHCVRQLRRDLFRAGRPDLANKVHRGYVSHVSGALFTLGEQMSREDCAVIVDVARERWPDLVDAVDDSWWAYYVAPGRRRFPERTN